MRERERGSLHELTAELIKQSNTFYVENLNVLNMVKNHKIARSILEANWGAFIQMLTYKAESAGGKVVKVDPKDTSQHMFWLWFETERETDTGHQALSV